MTPQQLLAAALAQRDFWVPIAAGKRVKLRRPAETSVLKMLRPEGEALQVHAGLDEVKAHAVGWDGFTEADFMAGGANDSVDFDAALWAVWIDDHRDDIAPLAQGLVDAIVAHEQKAVDAAKN